MDSTTDLDDMRDDGRVHDSLPPSQRSSALPVAPVVASSAAPPNLPRSTATATATATVPPKAATSSGCRKTCCNPRERPWCVLLVGILLLLAGIFVKDGEVAEWRQLVPKFMMLKPANPKGTVRLACAVLPCGTHGVALFGVLLGTLLTRTAFMHGVRYGTV